MRVLQSFPRVGATTNPYLKQLLAQLEGAAEVRTFSWRNALFWDYDVFHVHWPDAILRYARFRNPATRALRPLTNRVAFLLLLGRLRLRRSAVVRTVHNIDPHEPPRWFDVGLLRRLDALTTAWIRLNPFTPVPAPDCAETILHGDYRSWFGAYPPVPTPVSGRLIFFGLMREYKGVGDLVSAFTKTTDPSLSLHLVGRPAPDSFASTIESAAQRDPRISTELEYVDEATLVEEIGDAELVVLPYREMHNSGVALLALSLDRPVLVPDNEVNRALAVEVGPLWVSLFEGTIKPADLTGALNRARQARQIGGGPDLSARSWADAGARHVAVYRRAMR